MSNFNLTSLVLKSYYGDNRIITDNKELPSVMVYIPKFKMSDVIDGGSDSVHPAFIVNGEEKDGIYISKYQNTVYNGRAYSLPGEDPSIAIPFDTAVEYCSAKGAGWHLMTAVEWGAIALWCIKNGWLPYGNNDYGKDAQESEYKAVPTAIDSEGKITRSATGTGPVEWSHNKELDGIYDLNGNVMELCGGMRLVYGELQILENNNAADSSNSQAAASTLWKAIDGTTGDLITPDGNGTTANSLKIDLVSGGFKWITGNISTRFAGARHDIGNVTVDDTVCDAAKELLYALALLCNDTAGAQNSNSALISNKSEDRIFTRGGNHSNGDGAGIFAFNCAYGRANEFSTIGFRSAYYE